MLKLDKMLKSINNELAKGEHVNTEKAGEMMEILNRALILNGQLNTTPKEYILSAYKIKKLKEGKE